MSDQNVIVRREITEERGNRHALYICFGLIFLLALLISVLGIAAYNSRFMLMPIVPREQLPPIKPAKIDFTFRAGWHQRGVGVQVTIPAASSGTLSGLAAGSTLREAVR